MARKSALNDVKDWPSLAKSQSYQAKRVALCVGVTLRCLEQYFRKTFKRTPLEQFTLWIAENADKKLEAKMVGKQILADTGYAHQSSLSRALTNARGHGLRRGRKRGPE
jgi:transcriptional regulator GlxA family with amidase domain